MNRKHNFSAGPTGLPLEVMTNVQEQLLDFKNQGMSLIEMSHRTPVFDDVISRAKAGIAELYELPDTHEIMFLQGGAALQFAMIPLNMGSDGAYVDTGVWSQRAIEESRLQGTTHILYSGAENNYTELPSWSTLSIDPKIHRYVHFTSNNTIYGTQFHEMPDIDVPVICDMSSDFISRPIDVSKFDIIYAGAQKNAGPSGVTIVLIKKSISRNFTGAHNVPKIMRYQTQAQKDSMYNTPNTFGIWVVGLVADWVRKHGGLSAMAHRNSEKANLLYQTVAQCPGLELVADEAARSQMNVTFRGQTTELEQQILGEANTRGIVGIRGHRSVGGLRASIYNAVSLDDVKALCKLLEDCTRAG